MAPLQEYVKNRYPGYRIKTTGYLHTYEADEILFGPKIYFCV